MDTKNPACAGCRRVLQLPVHARDISGMGCRSHRVLQRILPLHLRDSLPDCNGGNTGRHTEFSDILTTEVMKRITEYNKTGNRPVQRAALERRLFLFAGDTQRMNRFKIEIAKNNQTIHVPMNYRAKVADASYRQARSGLAVSWEKSSSPKGCGIFPENLACRKPPLLPPYSSTGHVKPEYSPLKLKKYGTTSNPGKSGRTDDKARTCKNQKNYAAGKTIYQTAAPGHDRTGARFSPAGTAATDYPPPGPEPPAGRILQRGINHCLTL